MRVGVDAFVLGSHGGGIETYVRNVIGALGAIDPDGDYALLLNHPLPAHAIPRAERMRQVVAPARYGRWRVPFATSLALMRERIDVVHVQEAAPLLFPSKIVLTLHDIAYERYPHFFDPAVVKKLRVRVPTTIRRAAAIVTDSEYSKRDIMRRYGVPLDGITVAPLAADPIFRPLHDEARMAAIRERYVTGQRFIVCVGDLQPRKNLKTLIEAYVRLRRQDIVRHKLVLIGRRAWLFDDIFAAARASGYKDDLVFTGYVPDDDLVALYNAADLFVYPSIYEGFGLPPLEAMACGTPVITSDTSSLPEVVGDAGLMVAPLDVEALATAMARALRDADLLARLSAKGLRRASTYSWESTARIILGVYRDVMDQPDVWP